MRDNYGESNRHYSKDPRLCDIYFTAITAYGLGNMWFVDVRHLTHRYITHYYLEDIITAQQAIFKAESCYLEEIDPYLREYLVADVVSCYT